MGGVLFILEEIKEARENTRSRSYDVIYPDSVMEGDEGVAE
jgi:hypothetical protein